MPANSLFPIRIPEDDEGFDKTLGGEEKRFIVGQIGDPLMCPFQCNLCHFQNIEKRGPSARPLQRRPSFCFLGLRAIHGQGNLAGSQMV
jgi:hypothetical protein